MKPKPPLHWIIDRFENGGAVLIAEDSSQLTVPRCQLPDKAKEGDVLSAEFYLTVDEKKRRENLARALLEEILGS